MAIVPYIATEIQTLFGHAWRIQWLGMTAGDTGVPLEQPIAADRSIQIEGTFGGTVTIQGTNEACHETTDNPHWETLHDPQGNPITPSAAALTQISEVTAGLRPSIGAGVTAVTVTLVMRTNL